MFASKVPSTPHTKKPPQTGEDQRPFFRLAVQQAEVPRRHGATADFCWSVFQNGDKLGEGNFLDEHMKGKRIYIYIIYIYDIYIYIIYIYIYRL